MKKYEHLDFYEIRRIFSEVLSKLETTKGWNEDKKGKSWTDDELRIILLSPPTKENCLKYARAFNRGYGAIEQIYRWAATSDKRIKKERPNDAFVAQIKKVAKQLGWRAA